MCKVFQVYEIFLYLNFMWLSENVFAQPFSAATGATCFRPGVTLQWGFKATGYWITMVWLGLNAKYLTQQVKVLY